MGVHVNKRPQNKVRDLRLLLEDLDATESGRSNGTEIGTLLDVITIAVVDFDPTGWMRLCKLFPLAKKFLSSSSKHARVRFVAIRCLRNLFDPDLDDNMDLSNVLRFLRQSEFNGP